MVKAPRSPPVLVPPRSWSLRTSFASKRRHRNVLNQIAAAPISDPRTAKSSKPLVKAVRTALDRLFEKRRQPADWTVAVKKALCRACLECHSDAWVGASRVKTAGREWLYDVSCLLYDPDGYVRRTPLVAEVEWSQRTAIWYDFEKLLVARADVRVMVLDGTWWANDDERFVEFAEYIKRLETAKPRDTYLLVAWLPHRFEYRQFPKRR